MWQTTPISEYLLPPVRQRRQIRRGIWIASLRSLSSNNETVIGGLAWLLLAMVVAAGLGNHSLARQLPLASSLSHPVSTPRPATVKAVSQLAEGPTGQLLPPGNIAAPGTYRNNYSPGECTWYVAGRRPVPGNWGNANTWYSRAQAAGWKTGPTPAVGAIAWTSAGRFGHVALVLNVSGSQVQITEMNYGGRYRTDQRWVNASSFRYIY